MSDRLNELLTLCSDDLDDKISAHMGLDLSDPTHAALLLRIRCDKAIEEVGEAHAEIIAYEGSNPRKAGNGSLAALGDELLDGAFTNLLAFHHVTGRAPIDALEAHVARKALAYYGIEVPDV